MADRLRRFKMANLKENFDDVLVFGYSCKLFRDDEKAISVDKGQHLIPWMGNPAMPIDRYDVRGLLSDLSKYEAKNLDPNLKYSDYLSPEDALIEEMCDDERYRSLTIVEEQDSRDNDEEEDKRTKTNAFGFDYNSANSASGTASTSQPVVSEEDFLRNLANVIEKTSEFISRQGAQMEILMRAKEANNPKFQFLNPDNPYHQIYKQVLEKKRHRLQNPGAYDTRPEETIDVEQSLKILTRNLPSAAPTVPTIKYDSNPSDSAYSRLVEKILENRASEKSATPSPPPPPAPLPVPVPTLAAPKNDEDEDTVMVSVPPPELQRLIDQTASYVCKNGSDKLAMVKKRQKEQFEFLFPGNQYNLYYQYKRALYQEMIAEDVKNGKIPNPPAKDGKSTKKFPTLKGFFN